MFLVFELFGALVCLSCRAYGADQAVLQTSSLPQVNQMTAYGNTHVVGYSALATAVTGAEATGGVYISYYDELSADYNLLSAGGLSETKLVNPYKLGEFGNVRTDANGNAGFGQSLAMSSETELFISASSVAHNTGRVYCYRGRNSQWSVMQTLSPHSTAKGETYINIDSYFGGSIAATSSVLAVGCQNCNSSDATPQQGGEVYVYAPNPARTSWSASQILTSENVKFLGEQVAVHSDLIVATGDAILSLNIPQSITDFPKRAVIFQRPKGKDMYSSQQILSLPSATSMISEVAVYDETVVLSASKYLSSVNTDEIFIYYPRTPRFGWKNREGPKAKSKPVQWSLFQTLTPVADTRGLNFYLSIRGNNLIYSSFTSTKDQVTLYTRSSLTGPWSHSGVSDVDLFERAAGTSDLFTVLTPNQKLYFVNLGAASNLFKPIDLNPSSFHCLQIYVGDHFGDGWDTALLTVESPSGRKVSYAPDCDTYNPILYRYCPLSNDDRGIYKLRIEHVKEASFPWEIMWKVYDERAQQWYFGTHETEMDFEWSEQFTDFTPRRMQHLHLNVTACPQCATSPPEAKAKSKPHPSLKHLRSLHGKAATSSPTMSPAPTIEVAGVDSSSSLYFKMSNAASASPPWFDSENSGTSFFISDVDGRKLYSTGTACVSGLAEVSCWAELPDGDYVARVGGALDSSVNRQWKFCGGVHYQAKQTELYFSVQFGLCSASMTRSHSNVCNNVLLVSTLFVEIELSGDFLLSQSLPSGSLQVIKSYIDSFLYKKIGHFSVSADITSTSFERTSASVGVRVGMGSLSDGEVSALVSVLKDSADVELEVSSLSLGGQFGIDTISLRSMIYLNEMEDLHAIDESNFHAITNFITTDMEIEGYPEGAVASTTLSDYFKEMEYNWYAYASAAVTLAILVVVVFTFKTERGENGLRSMNETTSSHDLEVRASAATAVDETTTDKKKSNKKKKIKITIGK